MDGATSSARGGRLGQCRDAVNRAVATASKGRMVLGAVTSAEPSDYKPDIHLELPTAAVSAEPSQRLT